MTEAPEKLSRFDYGNEVRIVEHPAYICGGTTYVREDMHIQRVQDLLEANNRYQERYREAERRNKQASELIEKWFRQDAGDNTLKKLREAQAILAT